MCYHPPTTRPSSSSSTADNTSHDAISPSGPSPTFLTNKDLDVLLSTIPAPHYSDLSHPGPSQASTLDSAKTTLKSLLSVLSPSTEDVDQKLNMFIALQDPLVKSAVACSNEDILAFLQEPSSSTKVQDIVSKIKTIQKQEEVLAQLGSVGSVKYLFDDESVSSLFENRPAARAIFDRLAAITKKFDSLYRNRPI
ncbi:hypothetical protein GEMRC1_013697 [Eukaryota sp. GEM-RC1]